MKNVSKWLLAGSILAVAFACQPKKTDDEQKRKGGCGQQSSVEKSEAKPNGETAKPSASAAPVVVFSTTAVQPAAEKKAAPLSVPAQPVVEQKAAPAVKEKSFSTPVVTESNSDPVQTTQVQQGPISSASPVAAPVAPEVKSETSVKTAAPAAPAAVETHSSPAK